MTDAADPTVRLDALRREAEALHAAAAAVEPATPVPSCPGWTVADLLTHVGERYAFVAGHVRRGVVDPPPGPAAPDVTRAGWWEDGLRDVLDALATDPDLPAWNWSVAPKTVAFWQRRLMVETAVHRWDAEMAVGAPIPVAAAVAVEGIDEVVDVFLPSGRRGGPRDRHGVVRLTAVAADTDTTDAEWTVRLRGEAMSVLDTGTVLDHGPDAVTRVRGGASDLLLTLWGRVGGDVLDVEGDPSLLAAMRVA